MRQWMLVLVVLGWSGVATADGPPAGGGPSEEAGGTEVEAAKCRLHTLARKAEELQATGRQKEAEAVRREMEELRGELGQRLARLEQEVHALRLLTDRAPSIRIDVHVVEVDRAKLPDSILEGLGWCGQRSEGDSAASCDAVGVRTLKGDAAGIIQALGEAKAAKVLASPAMIGLSGRPTMFSVGSELPFLQRHEDGSYSVKYQHCGKKLELLPEWIEGEQLRLTIRTRIAVLDPEGTIEQAGEKIHALRVTEAATSLMVESGQTLCWGGLAAKSDRGKVETILLVRARLIRGDSPE